MIGDDAGTAAFRQWWHEEGVPAGGRLVYNTGRALDLFEQLLQDKGQVLPEPDMLISAIGTRIYTKRGGRWQEDEGYTAQLGRGWQLEGVREACYKALATVGKDAMHFRPPNEMSEHKVTCGVRLNVLDKVLATIRSDLQQAGIRHRLVVSGSGDWRFMDLVPAEAGKLQVPALSCLQMAPVHEALHQPGRRWSQLVPAYVTVALKHAMCPSHNAPVLSALQALEYARRTMEFEPHQTVACGDSGNDIDMLEGGHLSIIVGNAHKELLEWAATQRAAHAGEVYVAQGQRAWGILEGLQRYGFKA
jgi:hydroxymethylpyrimidine pyrophosphatase-like HAD family hydrolase